MACPLCGDLCSCSNAGDLAGARTTVLIDPDSLLSETAVVAAAYSEPVAVNQSASEFYRPTDTAWRTEISSRVRAHRRRRGYDPDASLELGLEAPVREEVIAVRSRFSTESRETISNSRTDCPERPADSASENEGSRPTPSRYQRIAMKRREAQMESGVLIEFPRPQTYDLFPDALAEPLPAVPRILEAPEALASADAASDGFASACQSAYASIELDSPTAVAEELAEPVAIELPLQVAPVSPRAVSAMIDAGLVCTATALFVVTVLLLAPFGPAESATQMSLVPAGRYGIALSLSLPVLFWAGYQYLFLVFAGVTPGMQMAQLELSNFEGCVPTRRTRAARAIALLLSCISLGMGFAWSLFDEDSLGWHDRITRTYLRQS
jgi:uncharacterized RDD family membrane protein YckC